jgi:hypothetical protein
MNLIDQYSFRTELEVDYFTLFIRQMNSRTTIIIVQMSIKLMSVSLNRLYTKHEACHAVISTFEIKDRL